MTDTVSSEAPSEPVTLRQLILLFTRRWRIFAGVWALVVALTAVYTFAATRQYRPQATLEIRPETPPHSPPVPAPRWW